LVSALWALAIEPELAIVRRRGRKRKAGQRQRDGRLVKAWVSVAQVAATMPHRKGLAHPADQRAESELGRMVLRGELEEEEGLAGEQYRREWRRYVVTLSAPRDLGKVAGGKSRCNECAVASREFFCLCEARKRAWDEAREVLCDTGTTRVVDRLVLQDQNIEQALHWILKLGLSMLARHYGLVGKKRMSHDETVARARARD